MLFKRREKVTLWTRLATFLWPRGGPTRAFRYLWHRLARMPDTSHRLAAGVASGAAVSFTPFVGLHFILGFTVAFITRGNMLAAAIGTAVGNPWTFPFIFALAGQVGDAILGSATPVEVPAFSFAEFWAAPGAYLAALFSLLYPLIIGSVPVAVGVWAVVYLGLKVVLHAYKGSREKKILGVRCERHPDDEICVEHEGRGP